MNNIVKIVGFVFWCAGIAMNLFAGNLGPSTSFKVAMIGLAVGAVGLAMLMLAPRKN